MKANHNIQNLALAAYNTVSYGSKILKWKQITTLQLGGTFQEYCFLWFKDTKMKANHNEIEVYSIDEATVSYGSKILKWKQITTTLLSSSGCATLFPMVQRY